MNYKIKHVLENLPSRAGVYFMKDITGKIIYIGKAKNLKNRVSSYFNSTKKNIKTQLLVSNIDDIEYVLASSEEDAFSLESNLIKENQPKYNILLKDDKLFPYIRIDKTERFPEIKVVRRVKNDSALYFGPYVTGLRVSEIISIIKSVFPVRQCSINFDKTKKKARMCLFGDMGKCKGPCVGKISNEDYLKIIDEVIEFLEGRNSRVKRILTEKMNDSAESQDFEQAIVYRNQLEILEKSDKYILSNLAKDENLDVFTIDSMDGFVGININCIRNGKTIQDKNVIVDTVEETLEECLESFLLQYYSQNLMPAEVLVNREISPALEQILSEQKGKKVTVRVPKIGTKFKIMQVGEFNVREKLEKNLNICKSREEMSKGAVLELAKMLELPTAPDRIECYDISNISGTDSVASMVVFEGGVPAKKEYRKFRIKTVQGADDFKSLAEVLERRFKHLKEGDEHFSRPDLIVIDGGLGQLNAVKQVADDMGMEIPIISLAKQEEEIFTTKSSESIKLSADNVVRKLLQRVRDEAHRFAITYHRETRDKNFFR